MTKPAHSRVKKCCAPALLVFLVGIFLANGTLLAFWPSKSSDWRVQVSPASVGSPGTIAGIKTIMWNRSFGWDEAETVSICTDGQFIYTGGDCFNTSSGGYNLNVVNWTRDGEMGWNVTWWINSVDVSSKDICYFEGSLYLAGYSQDSLNYHTPYLWKWYDNGTLDWAQSWDRPDVLFYSLVIDHSGIYVLGENATLTEINLVKFDFAGNEVWNKTWAYSLVSPSKLQCYEGHLYAAFGTSDYVSILKWNLDGIIVANLTLTPTFQPWNIECDETGIYVSTSSSSSIFKLDYNGHVIWKSEAVPGDFYTFYKAQGTCLSCGKKIASFGQDGVLIDTFTLGSEITIWDCLVLDGDLYCCGGNNSAGELSYLGKYNPDRFPAIQSPRDFSFVRGEQARIDSNLVRGTQEGQVWLSWTIWDDWSPHLHKLSIFDGYTDGWWGVEWENNTQVQDFFSVVNVIDGVHNFTLQVSDGKYISQATVLITIIPRFPLEMVIGVIAAIGGGLVVAFLVIRHRKTLNRKSLPEKIPLF